MSKPVPLSGSVGGDRTRSRIVMTLIVLLAFAALISLGVWQWQRYDWKTALIARFETGLAQPPSAYDPVRQSEFGHVRVTGEFLNSRAVKLLTATPEAARERTKDGFGYLVFTPLRYAGGIVFVNRGFVPQSLSSFPALLHEGQIEVTGIVRLSQEANWFMPPADAPKRLFFAPDIPAMASAAGLKPGETIVSQYIQEEPVPGAAEWPEPRDPRELLGSIPNLHLEYALVWFGLAAGLAGVYGAYIFRNARVRR